MKHIKNIFQFYKMLNMESKNDRFDIERFKFNSDQTIRICTYRWREL